jgi:hypothetical protein
MTTPREFDPIRALQTLNRHKVRYVLIGGFAGKLLGSTILTVDIDICYARDRGNLEHLAAALQELHAYLRGAPEGLPFRLDADTLQRGDSVTFVTDAGDLDILGTPSGTTGYEELSRNATTLDLGEVTVQVAALEDLIAMKRASGRPRDRIHLEVLAALRDEIEREAGAEAET